MVRPHAAARLSAAAFRGDVQCKSQNLLNLLLLKERMFSQLCVCVSCENVCGEPTDTEVRYFERDSAVY